MNNEQQENELRNLVLEARKGNEESIRQLYDRTIKSSYYITMKYIRNTEEQKDILQESYAIAFKKLDTLNDCSKFPQWVSRIVTNKTIDFCRKNKNNRLMLSMNEKMLDDESEFIDFVEDEDWAFKPKEQFDYTELKNALKNLIEELREDQQICLLMYYYEQYSINEIAEELNVSANTVKSRLNYARNKIKSKIENLEKQGVKLFTISPAPLLLWFYQAEANSISIPAEVVIGSLATATTSTIAASTTAGISSATSLGASIASKTILTKVIVTALSVAVVTGGGYGVYKATQKPSESGQVDNNTETKTSDKNNYSDQEIKEIKATALKNTYEVKPATYTKEISESPILLNNSVYVFKNAQGYYAALNAEKGIINRDIEVEFGKYKYLSRERNCLFIDETSAKAFLDTGASDGKSGVWIRSDMFKTPVEFGGVGGSGGTLVKRDGKFYNKFADEYSGFVDNETNDDEKQTYVAVDDGTTLNENSKIYLLHNGKQIVECNFKAFKEYNDLSTDIIATSGSKFKGNYTVTKGETTVIYNQEGKKLGAYSTKNLKMLSEKFYSVKDKNLLYLYDENGELYYVDEVEDISAPFDNKAFIKKDGKWNMIMFENKNNA